MASKNTTPKFENLVASVDKAQQHLDEAKAKLNEALAGVEVGHVVTIGNLPYEIRELKGRKEMKCMLTKRQIAAVRGEEIPPVKSRVRRTKAQIQADLAAE